MPRKKPAAKKGPEGGAGPGKGASAGSDSAKSTAAEASAAPANTSTNGMGSSGEAPCKENVVLTADASKIDATIPGATSVGSSGEAPCEETAAGEGASSSQDTAGTGHVGSSGEAPTNEEPEVCSAPSVSQEPLSAAGSGEAPLQEQNESKPEEIQACAAPDAHAETPEKAGSSGEAPPSADNGAPESTGEVTRDGDAEGPGSRKVSENPEQVGGSGEAPEEIEAEVQKPTSSAALESAAQADSSCEAQQDAASVDVLHGGGSGEAPLREEPEVVEPSVQTSNSDVAGTVEAADSFLSGDYHFSNPEDGVQCVLRLRPAGQWWHAAHRASTERGRILEGKTKGKKSEGPVNIHKAYKDYDPDEEKVQDLSQLEGNYEDFNVWEMADTIGSWREVQVISEAMKASGSAPMPGVLLTCENCNWHSNYPNATLAYRPTKDDEEEVYKMLDEGQLVLCFVLRRSEEGSDNNLELHMDLSSVCERTGAEVENMPKHSQIRPLQTAFQTLGFTRAYAEGPQPSSSASASGQPTTSPEASGTT